MSMIGSRRPEDDGQAIIGSVNVMKTTTNAHLFGK